eukprot:4305247-Amphidinium_carterae.1
MGGLSCMGGLVWVGSGGLGWLGGCVALGCFGSWGGSLGYGVLFVWLAVWFSGSVGCLGGLYNGVWVMGWVLVGSCLSGLCLWVGGVVWVGCGGCGGFLGLLVWVFWAMRCCLSGLLFGSLGLWGGVLVWFGLVGWVSGLVLSWSGLGWLGLVCLACGSLGGSWRVWFGLVGWSLGGLVWVGWVVWRVS